MFSLCLTKAAGLTDRTGTRQPEVVQEQKIYLNLNRKDCHLAQKSNHTPHSVWPCPSLMRTLKEIMNDC